MIETDVLYSVTATVIVGLVAWVAVVLKTAKEPWARPPLPVTRAEDVAVEPVAPVAISDVKTDASAEAKAEAKLETEEAKLETEEAKLDAKIDDAAK